MTQLYMKIISLQYFILKKLRSYDLPFTFPRHIPKKVYHHTTPLNNIYSSFLALRCALPNNFALTFNMRCCCRLSFNIFYINHPQKRIKHGQNIITAHSSSQRIYRYIDIRRFDDLTTYIIFVFLHNNKTKKTCCQ